jgi:hypothetical protein
MKRKSKAIGFLITGVALAVGIAISSGIIRNSYVADEAKALQGDVVATFQSSTVVTDTSYKMYQNDDWLLTRGGNTVSGGTNNSSRASCNLGASDYIKYAGNSGVTTSNTAFAIASKKSLSSVGKVILTHNGGSNNTRGSVYVTSSSNGTTYSMITLTSGTQGATPTASMTYEFSTIGEATYYAIVIKDSGDSGNYRFDNIVATFYEGAPARTLDSLSISGTLTKTSYYAGESFDPTGLTITANYDDESSANVTSECTFSPDPLTAGVTSVTASYTEGGVTKTADITGITVSTRTIETLEVTNNPTKMVYIVGESFDPTGMVVRATFDNGDPVDNYTGYVYSPSGALNSVGTQVITISDAVETEVIITLNVQVNEAPLVTELFISEYIEGSSNNKAIEIFNGTTASVNLSLYQLRLYGNGASSPTATISLSGSLASSDVYVIVNNQASQALKDKADLLSGSLGFNGDDAISLAKSESNIDVIGTIGLATIFASDATLVRKSSVSSPVTTYDTNEWISYAVDTFDHLGSHSISTPQDELDAIAWGTDFLSATAAGCSALDQSQLLTAWSGLETSFNALSSEAKNYLTSLTPNVSGNDAQHAVARYIYIITKYGDATFTDFMNLDIQAAPSVFDLFDDGYNYVPLIAVIGVVGLTVLIGYYYLKKRQEA